MVQRSNPPSPSAMVMAQDISWLVLNPPSPVVWWKGGGGGMLFLWYIIHLYDILYIILYIYTHDLLYIHI